MLPEPKVNAFLSQYDEEVYNHTLKLREILLEFDTSFLKILCNSILA